MEKIFHQRWWDYSNEPLNLGGYVCLKFSLAWGFACVFIVRLIHPTISWLLSLMPHTLGIILLCVLGAGLLVDILATIKTIAGINQELRSIDEGAAQIKKVSDDITEVLYETAIKAKADAEKKKVEAEELKARVRAEKEKIEEELSQKLTRGQKRILKAFPQITSTKHTEAMEELKKRLKYDKRTKK